MKRPTLFLTAALASIAPLKAQLIDNISDGGFTTTVQDGETEVLTQAGNPGNILGGQRQVTVTSNLGAWTAAINAPMGVAAAAGPNPTIALSLSSMDPEALGTVGLLYNAGDSLGGLNLTSGGFNSFAVSVLSLTSSNTDPLGSPASFDLIISALDSSGTTGMTRPLNITDTGLATVPFSEFAISGVDFTSIDSLLFQLETVGPGTNFSINSIGLVPEPSTALLGLIGLSLICRRRREMA